MPAKADTNETLPNATTQPKTCQGDVVRDRGLLRTGTAFAPRATGDRFTCLTGLMPRATKLTPTPCNSLHNWRTTVLLLVYGIADKAGIYTWLARQVLLLAGYSLIH